MSLVRGLAAKRCGAATDLCGDVSDFLPAATSCCQPLIEFFQHGRQFVAEKLIGFAEAAKLVERHVFKIIGLDGEASGDVGRGWRRAIGAGRG